MTVFVINLGSQYTHVIWRSIRDLGYEVVIESKDIKFEKIKNAEAIILSGGPGSVSGSNFGTCNEIMERIKKNEFNAPLLGICLGHQFIAHSFGGIVEKGKHAEYGIMKVIVDWEDVLFKGLPKEFNVWISHFDEVKKLPKNFIKLAHSEVCEFEAIRHKEKDIFGVQFHPEVWHTEHGEEILRNFLEADKDIGNRAVIPKIS